MSWLSQHQSLSHSLALALAFVFAFAFALGAGAPGAMGGGGGSVLGGAALEGAAGGVAFVFPFPPSTAGTALVFGTGAAVH